MEFDSPWHAQHDLIALTVDALFDKLWLTPAVQIFPVVILTGHTLILPTTTLQTYTHLLFPVDTCRRCSRFFDSGISIKLLPFLTQVQQLKELLFIKSCTLLFPFCGSFCLFCLCPVAMDGVCFRQMLSWLWELPVAVYLNQALPSLQYFNSDSTVVFISLKESPTFDVAKP